MAGLPNLDRRNNVTACRWSSHYSDIWSGRKVESKIIIIIIIIIARRCGCSWVQVCSVSTLSRNVTAAPLSPSSSRRPSPSRWLADVCTTCDREVPACRRRLSACFDLCRGCAACSLCVTSASSPSSAVFALTWSTGCRCRRASRNTSSRAAAAVAVSIPWRLGAILLPRCAGQRASIASLWLPDLQGRSPRQTQNVNPPLE